MALISDSIGRLLARFKGNKRGTIAVIAAVSALPITVGLGMGVDYTMASYRQTALNGFADSATLAGVTPAMMAQAPANAQAAAQTMFMSQAQTLPEVNASLSNVTVTATDTNTGAAITRRVVLTYNFTSNNVFASLLHMNAMNVGGSSTATSSAAPQINWYMLLDDSPSMAIAATTADIATMVANTSSQGGCAFACHETHPSSDSLGNPGGEDNYALARNLGVNLRIDLVNTATQSLMSYAQTTAAQYSTIYKAAIYTMDYTTNALIAAPGGLAAAATAASNLQALTVYNNNCLTVSNCNSDQDSYLDAGISTVNTAMPNPGNGTSNPGDTPQEVLFIVTDGVTDYNNGGRKMSAINTDYSWCSTVKARGIRIAFLYLTYYPLPTNSFYNSNIAPFQPNIPTAAQNCASPGLFFQVSTDGDITGAMQSLFARAVATAHLLQ